MHLLRLTVAAAAIAIAACRQSDPAAATEFAAQELTTSSLPASPTNVYADDARAADLGRRLFFDRGFSSDGTISCASCHDPQTGFSDSRAVSTGVRGQSGDRHAMPVTTAAMMPFLLWDGRADSVWLQPLKAVENSKEMDFPRAEVARRLGQVYRKPYEAIFGSMEAQETDRVFANFGKAIEAYERKLLCANTRFDRWLRGEETLTSRELAGGGVFRDQNCARCHSGPAFSDGKFHDIDIPSNDPGRSAGAPVLRADLFNGGGAFSDDPQAGRAKLDTIASEGTQDSAFRTASLRGVGQRTFFGHASHERTLRGFILDIYNGGGDGRRGNRGRGDNRNGGNNRDPLLDGVNVDGDEVDDLIAFLRTLDCPLPPAELLAPTAISQ